MSDVEHLSVCLLAICMSSLEKEDMSVSFFGPFFYWVIYFSGIELDELQELISKIYKGYRI